MGGSFFKALDGKIIAVGGRAKFEAGVPTVLFDTHDLER
jgi:hypothetical protein